MQSLKGLACILVVAFHVIGYGPHTGLELPDESWLRKFSAALSLLRMPLFTFLSGYLFSLRPVATGQYWRFLRKKLTRLYVPAVVVGVLYLVVSMIVPGNGVRPGLLEALRLPVYPFGHFWFIQSLIVILIVAGFAQVLGLLSTPQRYLLVLLGAIAIHLFGTTQIQLFSFGGAQYLLPFFFLGIGVHRYAGLVPRRHWIMAAVVGVFCVTFAIHIAGVTGIHGAPLGQRTPLALLLSISSVLIVCHIFPVVKPLEFIGRYSFTIYLFHVLFTAGMRTLARASGMDAVGDLFVFGLLGGIAGPMLVEVFVKRMPGPFSICLLGSNANRQRIDLLPIAERSPSTPAVL